MSTINISISIDTIKLRNRMLLGAGIGLFLITFFLVSAGEGNPAWGDFWMIRPLIVVPFAGATGGACYYFLDQMSRKGSLRKVLTNILSFLVYIFGLWMGTVIGLVGTYWN